MATALPIASSTEALFDKLGQKYQDTYDVDRPGLQQLLLRVSNQLLPGADVLDLGCGTGKPVSKMLADAGCRVTAIDLSQQMVDIAKSNVPSASVIKANMMKYRPDKDFDGIFAIFSLIQLPRREIYSMAFKMAQWLKPGGLFVFATVDWTDQKFVPEHPLDPRGEWSYLSWMGHVSRVNTFSPGDWLKLLNSTGITIQSVEASSYANELEYFFIGKRSNKSPFLGPYPLPSRYRGPHELSQKAWAPFAERLTRQEIDAVAEVLDKNRKVLDVGSGHGELPRLVARKVGECFAIDPNEERHAILSENTSGSTYQIHVEKGSIEALPYADRTFDAAVAMWVLHYVQDLEQSLREMARVVDPSAPDALLIVVQSAPDNEVVNLINETCCPLAREPIDHQGYLLSVAVQVFTECGFGNIQFKDAEVSCDFPETDMGTRCARAADVLQNFWYYGHPQAGAMRAAMIPALERHFESRPNSVGDRSVILTARPTLS